MTKLSCAVPDCEETCYCRGWCRSHYGRWYRTGDPLPPRRPTQLERYWSKVDPSGGPDACWPWTEGCNPAGYGVFCHGQEVSLAHRWGYENRVGPIPDGHSVLHTCDNPPCQNDRHWFTGTRADNVHDMVSKGRNRVFRGSEHYRTRLGAETVRQIRRRYAAGSVTHEQLAHEYHVSASAVARLLRRESWKNVS